MAPIVQDRDSRPIAIWLLICAAVIYGMIILGGVTRLTESGLSMVEWKPLMGIIPPLTEEHWQETFEKYKQFPEYQKINRGMDLSGFKKIFAFEYAHRVLGRLIGLLFFIPFIYFLIRGKISKSLSPRLWILLVLGGLQGLMGWYMVKSGLVDVPRVSQYRLTAHLGLAVVIYGFMMWVIFDLLFSADEQPQINAQAANRIRRFSMTLNVLIFLMILSGGLVAGLDAGFAYNTFPLMDGKFFPVGLFNLEPFWLNIFNDVTTVQFNHRFFAYVISLAVAAYTLYALSQHIVGRLRLGVILFPVFLILQVSLGILTLVYVVPVSLAAAHQAGAVALLTVSLFVSHAAKRSFAQ
ncbi:COX15/CtaA family protein [Aurantivibrio plasticivorans]